MELRFLKQKHEGMLTELDEIELVNCDRDSGYENGPYTVARLEDDGGITIVGKGPLSGYVAVIYLD
jgi:hypothetical protein